MYIYIYIYIHTQPLAQRAKSTPPFAWGSASLAGPPLGGTPNR